MLIINSSYVDGSLVSPSREHPENEVLAHRGYIDNPNRIQICMFTRIRFSRCVHCFRCGIVLRHIVFRCRLLPHCPSKIISQITLQSSTIYRNRSLFPTWNINCTGLTLETPSKIFSKHSLVFTPMLIFKYFSLENWHVARHLVVGSGLLRFETYTSSICY